MYQIMKIIIFTLASIAIAELCRRIALKYSIGINKHFKRGNALLEAKDYDGAIKEKTFCPTERK